MTIQPTPPFLWGNDKKLLPYGIYQGLIPQPLTQPWDGNNGLFSQRRWQRKAWVFIGVCTPDFYGGLAICDAGYLGKPFAYIYDVKSGQLLEEGASVPMGFAKDADWCLKDDWKIKNYHIYTEDNQIIATFKGKKFELRISLQDNERGLSFICPSKNRPFHFTYKNLLLPARIEWSAADGKKHPINNAFASIDFSKGYPPRHTFWNWTSFMGHADTGIPVGINLVDGFNGNLENALWYGNQTLPLGKVNYEYIKASEHNAWRVHNEDLDITMQQPLGARHENMNVLLAKSKFIQVFGNMTGKIRLGGEWKMIEGAGVMEEHEAKW